MSGAGEAALRAATLSPPAIRFPRSTPVDIAPATVIGHAGDAGLSTRSRAAVRGITVESSLYLIFLALAVVSRFWNLGAKALHHDESLHAYYSWLYATGEGYRHDPLMHGPFLFHANALVYLLFGDSDASSRYMPALFGVAMVGLPFLLRGPKHLGRWGALAASLLFLISPAILYQSRYIRHDIYTIVGTLLFFICIVRYIEKPERCWLMTGAASAGFLLTNHEIVFAVFAIFGLFLYGTLLVSRSRAWWPTRPGIVKQLIAVHAGFVAFALGLFFLIPQKYKHELLDIPWKNPTRDQQWDYYRTVVTNPLVLGLVTLGIGFLFALRGVLMQVRAPIAEDTEPGTLLADAPDGTVEAGIRQIWADRTGLAIALFIAAVIFVGLFTSLFTNLDGLVTSTIGTDGTLLYWLGQHNERRGEQPWFYFLLLMPQYEFIAVLFGTAMALLTCWRAIGAAIGRWSGGRNLFFRLFVTVWLVLIFAGLSFAGEKMPWLVVHISLPATILAAALIGGLIERAIVAVRVRRADPDHSLLFWPEWGLLAALLVAGGTWLAIAGRLSVGQFVADDSPSRGGWRRTLTSYDASHWWLLAIPPAAAVILLAINYFLRGPRRTGLTALTAATIGLALLQVHTGWHLSYDAPDVPKDMLVYTQTSPDVTRVMGEIEQLSEEMTGGKGLDIWYDSGVSWPMQWYLRDYVNKSFKGASRPQTTDDVAVILNSQSCQSGHLDAYPGYTAQNYVLRWWFPEETYRDFAIAPEIPAGRSAWNSPDDPHSPVDIIRSIGDSLGHQLTPEGQMRLYRLLLYRDLDWENGQCDFQLYIRNDLLPFFNTIRYNG